MQSIYRVLGLGVLGLLVGLAVCPTSADEIIIGGQCDRTGPTKNVGTQLCPGVFDYVKLIGKQGGIQGHTLRYIEVENAYKVDRGVEAYERLKREGAVIMLDYGTPIVYALTPRHIEDKLPGLTPGFGRADSTDGTRFPYIFPMAASYWSQMGAAMQHIKAQGGGKKGSKIAYLFYDNPAGREPLSIFNHICTQEGYECREFAVPPPGVEMGSQALDITRRMRPDWVVTHLFGKAPSISIKEFKKNGFPLHKVISLVWGAGEEDMQVAGWDTAEGYLGMQFAGVGRDFPVIQDIIKMYQEDKQEVPDYVGGVYYNRGVLVAALIAEGARHAIAQGGLPVTGEKMKQGFERIKDFTLGGFLPPLNVHPTDHEGGGWVRLYQTRGGKIVPFTDWFQGYRELVLDEVGKAAKTEAKP
ncbi:MAG: ABC transporter substrate-binding protein [Candidatus Tectimicrobiota bacterium]